MDFDGVSLSRLVLGCDPFQIVSAFYPKPDEKLREYRTNFSGPDMTVEIVKAAVKENVNALIFCLVDGFIQAVKKMKDDGLGLQLIPLFYQFPLKTEGHHIPFVKTEVTITNHRMYLKGQALYDDYVGSSEFKKIEAAKSLSKTEIEKMEIDREKMTDTLKQFAELGTTKILMTCIELYALIGRLDLLEKARSICEEFGFSICAGSHMAEAFKILDKEHLHFASYYAPLNKIGFFMFPNQNEMLKSILRIRELFMAIKPLAGGRIPPKEAFEYILNTKKNTVCMFGVSSTKEVAEGVKAFREVTTKR